MADVVFTTGGLGPTKDDITKKAYANFFEDEMIFSTKSMNISELISKKENASGFWNITKTRQWFCPKQRFSQLFRNCALYDFGKE
jgi:molybdopterin-biosynthesis enzyme MoeA-like protein